MTPKKPAGDDPLARLLNEAGAEVESRLRVWLAKAGKPGVPTPGVARVARPSVQPAPASSKSEPAPIAGAEARAVSTPRFWLLLKRYLLILGAAYLAVRFVLPSWKRQDSNVGRRAADDVLDAAMNFITVTFGEITMSGLLGSIVPLAIFVVGIIFVIKAVRVVPQQHALVVERLGRFDRVLEPGLRFTIPFVDRISARHDLREVPLDVPSQVCITKDNTQLQVDGILYFQVTDARLATYGSSNYIMAITQLAQTTLRSVIGKLELDKTFEERDMINHAVVGALDDAAMNWGVKVLRYEIKDLTPPKEILHAMQQQITAEREKRALIAASEGRKQEQINIAMGQKEAAIAKSEGDKISEINQAQGDAAATLARAEANAEAIRKIALAIESQGGLQAVNLKVAEQYVAALSNIARAGNTIVVPQNLTDVAGLVTAATSVLKASQKSA